MHSHRREDANVERRIIVMRHAKSSWSTSAATDHARPLNQRGRRDAPRVADRLTDLGWQPQHILSSDAQRTRETCELMLGRWEEGIGVNLTNTLYLAGPRELASELPGVSDEVETLLVLGHNPGWEGVVHVLSEQNVTMKTATAALLTCESCEEWSDALGRVWALEDVIYPRELAD